MEPYGQPERLETKDSEALSLCPSFSSYSSNRFAEIAAEVTDRYVELSTNDRSQVEDDDDFEFALVRSDPDVTADEIFTEGQFLPIFPVFNQDILVHDDKPDLSTLRIPLKKLFDEDREERDPPSSSSSEADELERIPPGTYCVWRPKAVEASPSTCKKSNSTGSASKRWNIRDLLRRSNSEGKDSFVFLTPRNRDQKAIENPKERRNSSDAAAAVKGKLKAKEVAAVGAGEKPPLRTSAHEVFYVRNRASKEGEKRKSYLPYRRDLVGFFANVNGVGFGRAFPSL